MSHGAMVGRNVDANAQYKLALRNCLVSAFAEFSSNHSVQMSNPETPDSSRAKLMRGLIQGKGH